MNSLPLKEARSLEFLSEFIQFKGVEMQSKHRI